MNKYLQKRFGISAVALALLAASWGISHAEEISVAGVYVLIEVNGEQLPANLVSENLHGERCDQVLLDAILLLDSEGRSAVFLTETVSCPSDADQEDAGKQRSVIIAGSYSVSGNTITIVDDFGTDEAVLEADVLVYQTGGNGRPVDKFVFRRE